jgi:hypothetical protein
LPFGEVHHDGQWLGHVVILGDALHAISANMTHLMRLVGDMVASRSGAFLDVYGELHAVGYIINAQWRENSGACRMPLTENKWSRQRVPKGKNIRDLAQIFGAAIVMTSR